MSYIYCKEHIEGVTRLLLSMIHALKFYCQGHNLLTPFIAIHDYSIIMCLNQTAVIEYLTVILEYIYKMQPELQFCLKLFLYNYFSPN